MMNLTERTNLRNEMNEMVRNLDITGFEMFGQSKDGIIFMNAGGQAFTIKTIVHTEKTDVYELTKEFELKQAEAQAKQEAKAKKVNKAKKKQEEAEAAA